MARSRRGGLKLRHDNLKMPTRANDSAAADILGDGPLSPQQLNVCFADAATIG
jgi:hypothetical protein